MIIELYYWASISSTAAVLLFFSAKKLKERLGVATWQKGSDRARIKQLETELNMVLKLKNLKVKK